MPAPPPALLLLMGWRASLLCEGGGLIQSKVEVSSRGGGVGWAAVSAAHEAAVVARERVKVDDCVSRGDQRGRPRGEGGLRWGEEEGEQG